MSLSVGKGILADAIKQLLREWNRAGDSWNDGNARAFEKKYIEALEPKVRMAIESMDELAGLSAAARRDCE